MARSTEPRLTDDDVRIWRAWQRAAAMHAQTRRFAKRVEQARRVIGECFEQASDPAVMWSGGKDSTVLTHLVCVTEGAKVRVVSEKDDLDYPGEREYVEHLAAAWGLRLDIVTPPISPAQWIAEHAHELEACDDLHSRAAQLSKDCFYGLVEEATQQNDAILLGLRKNESHGRMMNRVTRGLLYQARGKWTCQPLGDWTGMDVMAYMRANDIDPLPVYRCVAFMHAQEPWRVRKSWWIPGAHTRHGGVAWLRHYWPSLYQQLCAWIPSATRYA